MIIRDLHVLPALAWSRAVGRVAQLELPAPVLRNVIAGYVHLLDVEMADAVIPRGGFATFGEFFARQMTPGARPADETPASLLAPCDGVVQAAGELESARFEVKGRSWSVSELLGRGGWWESQGEGGYLVIYLSPADYHRVHSPTGGRIRDVWRLGGTCLPVNRLGQMLAPWAIVRNERVVFDIESELGPVAVVMVGALAVRAIDVSIGGYDEVEGRIVGDEVPVAKAEEIGVFNLGSTVVLLWQGRAQLDTRVGIRVNVGQRVALRTVQ